MVVARSHHVNGRRGRAGPESQLISRFLLSLPFRGRANHRVTIFREPRLQSGFPDLVLVDWHEPTAMHWDPKRADISTEQIRLMHLLSSIGPQPEQRLTAILRRRSDRQLSRLADVGLVFERKGLWHARSLRHTFAVRRIVAFEAKVGNWRAALEQASLNRWFATESYILLSRPPIDAAAREANAEKVGIWIVGEFAPFVRPPSLGIRQPVSYASWLFNEWAWKCETPLRLRVGGLRR